MTKGLRSKVRQVDDFWEWLDLAVREGWTDGLPVCPPTVPEVEAIIKYLGMDFGEILGVIPPKGGTATVEQIAVNALMAGCTPELVPVVISAVEAMLDPEFELGAVQITTNAAAPLVILGGPAVDQLGFNARSGSFAGGSRATATVGRAIRLILRNIGGAVPGDTSSVVHGHPGWYSFCVAENAEDSPWEPFHVRRGYAPDESCATVFHCQPPFPLYVPGDGQRILRVIAASLPTPGVNMYFGAGQMLLAFGPRPAAELARSGFSATDVQIWLWENARYRLADLRRWGIFGEERHTYYWGARSNAPDLRGLDGETMLPMVDSPDDIHVIVTGSSAQWWVGFCAGWGEFGGSAVTRVIAPADVLS